MKRKSRIAAAVVLSAIVVGAGALYFSGYSHVTLVGIVLNTFLSRNNPKGTYAVETNRETPAPERMTASQAMDPSVDPATWPSYNRTLSSQRFSPLDQLNASNVSKLAVLCSYDTHLHENFESGPLMVDGSLFFTTALGIYSLDPSTCKLHWEQHDDYAPRSPIRVNRGAAYLDGKLYRGTMDDRVVAYDAHTGKQLWSTTIGDPDLEQVDAALVAWNGLVFAGMAYGDTKGVRGRLYALDAVDGHIVWEDFLIPKGPKDKVRGPQGVMPAIQAESWKNAPDVPISGGGTWTSYTLDAAKGYLYVPVGNASPDFTESLRPGVNLFTNSVLVLDAKTGNYVSHVQVIPRDWHDWDVSNAPALFTTRAGKEVMSLAPKDGYLYTFDLKTNERLYRSQATRIENADVPLNTEQETHFCPGAVGGAEWNGVAFDPSTNLIYTGEDDWCTAVKIQTEANMKAQADGTYWMGANTVNPLDSMGSQDPHTKWAGWLYGTDADSGTWKWRLKTNYPILGGVTPTAGGLVFFGDFGGNAYAVDSLTGKPLWHQKLEGAIGGGVITYLAGGSQRVAITAGLSSILWPTEQATAKIVVLGLPGT